MSDALSAADDSKHIEELYKYVERLNEATDKSQNLKDYQGIIDMAKSSIKAKQLAAQFIPRFFKFFPSLSGSAIDTHLDLIEAEELGVRVQAIRGLPLFCKDTPEHIAKIVDILGQLLVSEEFVERDAVHKALMSLLTQDVKASLTGLFKHIGCVDEPSSDETIREKVLSFIRDKVFPIKAELLKPQDEMERHITDLIKKSLEDVTGAEFRMFMDFLKSLSIFGEKAPPERMKELIGIIEGQADLDAQFNVADADHIDRLISCVYMALPFVVRGASSSKFLNYLNKHIIPVFDKLPEERKLDLLKALAEISPYTTPQDSRQILPNVVQLLKKYMPRKKTGEEMNFTYVECLLYTFHHLAHKVPNATNSLCGYKIVTGQPSDRLGEDFSELNKDFTERLSNVEELTRATMKKLTQGMAEHNKAMAAAKSDEAKDSIKTQKQNTTTGLRTCNNILAMTKPLHSKTPSFIGDKSINLSWKEATKPSVPATTTATGGKRPVTAANGSGNVASKKGRGAGGLPNQLVNRALEGLSHGGRSGLPLEVNVVLIGFQGDGGYRYTVDSQKLEEFLRVSFPTHRPLCQETGEHLDIEHNIVYNTFHAGQAEFIVLEKSLKEAMVLAGTAREADYGRELPLFEVEATVVEPIFHTLYSYLFDVENVRYSAGDMDRPMPTVIFIVNFDKVRMDPRNKEIDHDSFMYGKITQLTEEDMKKQESEYIYRYRYNGGGASQVWLGFGRFAVIDLSAGPCTYGKIETEEGSVSSRTLPRLQHMIFPGGYGPVTGHSTSDIFIGQLASLISTTIEHVIAPDVRFEIVDQTTRLLVPIIVLQNHNRYNILEKGHNYSINIEAIEAELKKMVHDGHEVVMVGGSHSLHRHEKLSIAVSKAMRGHSLQETKNDGRFHVHTRTFLDGAILKEEMERSADVLAAGLLEVADPSLSSKYFLRQHWMDDSEGSSDSILKHKPLWASYDSKRGKKKKKIEKKQGDLTRTYGTRVIPVFVLSLADVDAQLMMEDGSLVWTSNDVVIVLEHQSEKIPLSYVSETERRHVVPSQAQRHILAGLASVVGGLSAPYEKASHVHERPVVNWLWATGCHPFGPFSNTSQISQILQDVALRNTIYARVDSALHRIHETSEAVEAFAAEHLKTPLGEPVKGKKNKTTTELWLEKFYKKTTNLPEPFPHELVERLEKYLDSLEEQLVDLSSLLYDHRLRDANYNSSAILQSSIFTQQYVDHVLSNEREKMRCCEIVYKYPVQSSQTYIYGGILLAGFFVYFLVIFFSNPVH